jgi:hypothetical protein
MTANIYNESDMNQQDFRNFANAGQQKPGLLGKLLALTLSAGLFVLAFMFSLAALVIVAVGGMLVGGWLWWKTRAVRKQMREASVNANAGHFREGDIIEGEVIRDTDAPIATGKLLP